EEQQRQRCRPHGLGQVQSDVDTHLLASALAPLLGRHTSLDHVADPNAGLAGCRSTLRPREARSLPARRLMCWPPRSPPHLPPRASGRAPWPFGCRWGPAALRCSLAAGSRAHVLASALAPLLAAMLAVVPQCSPSVHLRFRLRLGRRHAR